MKVKQNPLTLVVNLSLRSIRIIIFNDKAEKIYEDWMPVRTYINGATVEQDPNEWWDLLLSLLTSYFAKYPQSQDISYMTVTSSALCLVILDKKGKVLGKSLMVSDKRAHKESQVLQKKFTSFFKRHNFKVDASYMLPKIYWLSHHAKPLMKKAAFFLSSNDFLLYKLTGKIITDELNAEKFYYDTKTHTYPLKLLSHMGISDKNLPPVENSGAMIGEVNDTVREQIGAKQEITVTMGSYDAICALIGSSTYKEGELNNVCGTCSSYRFFSKSPKKVGNLLTQQLSDESMYIVGGSNNLEGGVLEWAKECFYGQDFLKDDNFLYSLMQKEAIESDLGANGIIFVPYLIGERMPFSDLDVRGTFLGIERFHTRKDIIRSVFEATAFQAKLVIDEFEKNGIAISSINMSGGVAKIPFAAQLRANVLGIPINVLAEVETTAVGAYIFSTKARNKITSVTKAAHLVKIEKQYIPNMHEHNCYASLFRLFKKVYTTTNGLYTERKEILDRMIMYKKQVLENL